MERHLHTVGARTLLFFPTNAVLRSGDPAVLAIAFGTHQPHCLLRGCVQTTEQERFRGAWLEFATSDTLSAATGCRDIRAPRLPSDLFVRVERKLSTPVLCRLQDVSTTGARVCGLGAQLSPGEELRFSLLGRFGPWRGWVCWSKPGVAGVRFDVAQSRIFESAFARPPVMIAHCHSADCGCLRGHLREPSVPRAFAAASRAARLPRADCSGLASAIQSTG